MEGQKNLGVQEPLSTLADEFKFNASFVSKVHEIAGRGYTHWRRVRGDGNCYYRAVGFSMLEQLLALCSLTPHRDLTRATVLHSKLRDLEFPECEERDAHQDLVDHVGRLCSGGGWEASAGDMTPRGGLYKSFSSPGRRLDLALVRALRRMTADYLLSNASDDEAGGGISFDVISMAQGYGNTADFCQQVVLPLGIEAEGIVFSALPRALGIGIRTVLLDRRESTEVTTCDYLPEGETEEPSLETLLHIQLRPGHYDVLYYNNIVRGSSPPPHAVLKQLSFGAPGSVAETIRPDHLGTEVLDEGGPAPTKPSCPLSSSMSFSPIGEQEQQRRQEFFSSSASDPRSDASDCPDRYFRPPTFGGDNLEDLVPRRRPPTFGNDYSGDWDVLEADTDEHVVAEASQHGSDFPAVTGDVPQFPNTTGATSKRPDPANNEEVVPNSSWSSALSPAALFSKLGFTSIR